MQVPQGRPVQHSPAAAGMARAIPKDRNTVPVSPRPGGELVRRSVPADFEEVGVLLVPVAGELAVQMQLLAGALGEGQCHSELSGHDHGPGRAGAAWLRMLAGCWCAAYFRGDGALEAASMYPVYEAGCPRRGGRVPGAGCSCWPAWVYLHASGVSGWPESDASNGNGASPRMQGQPERGGVATS